MFSKNMFSKKMMVLLTVVSLASPLTAAPRTSPATSLDPISGQPNPRPASNQIPYQPGEHYPPGTLPCGPQFIPHCYMTTPPNETVMWPQLILLVFLAVLSAPVIGIGIIFNKVRQKRYREEVAARVARVEQRTQQAFAVSRLEMNSKTQVGTAIPLATSLSVDDSVPERGEK